MARRRRRPPPPPPPPPPTPLAAIFYPLLSQRILDAVDVCQLGCVCRDLAACVRQFWSEAEREPGIQRRSLHVEAEGDDGDGDAHLIDASVWCEFSPCWGLWRPGGGVIRDFAYNWGCDCCYAQGTTYEYVFDAQIGWRLCRSCYKLAFCQQVGPFPYDVADHLTRFRIRPLSKLILTYGSMLPASILTSSCRCLRPKSRKPSPVFSLDEPHASVRRVAAFALTRSTPEELRRRWRSANRRQRKRR